MSVPSPLNVQKQIESSAFLRSWQKICAYFYVDRTNFPDRKKRAEAVVALSFMIVYASAWASYVPLYGIIFQNLVAASACAFIGLPTAVGALLIQRKTKNLGAACALLNYGCVLTLIGCIYATGGTWSPIYFWSFAPVAGAYLLSGSGHGIVVTAIAAIGNSLVAFTTRPHENPKQWFFQFDIFSAFHVGYFALTVLFSMSVFSLILFLFQKKLTQALQESETVREEVEIQKLRAEQAFETIKAQMAENKAVMNATEVALALIYPGLKIDAEKSSAYFQRLFPDMVNFMQALRKMGIESASDILTSVIGEDDLTWSMNFSSLPLEVVIEGNTHELEWKKLEVDGHVSGIVFAAKNVQPLLDSKKKAESVNQYAKLLVTIVGEQGEQQHPDKEKKSRKIHKAINRQIPQMSEAIARAEISLIDNWQPIYITLHTLKGEMNSFNFNELKEFLHRTEDHVKNVREILRTHRGRIEPAIAREIEEIKMQLIPDLKYIQEHLIEIQHICRQTGSDQSAIMLPRDRLLYAKDNPDLLRELINDCLYEDVRDLIKGFEGEIYKVAGDLGKPSPRILVSSPRFYLSDFAADKIRQALTHIIRNSLDHGIETREERVQKGKDEVGELTFVVLEQGANVLVKIRDDGRGLDLPQIKEKAKIQGLLQADRSCSNQEIAGFILLPGFSTTSSVSMISGRGIGMEAARGFMHDLGGAMQMNLLDDSDHPHLELVLHIPKAHVPMLGDILTAERKIA